MKRTLVISPGSAIRAAQHRGQITEQEANSLIETSRGAATGNTQAGHVLTNAINAKENGVVYPTREKVAV